MPTRAQKRKMKHMKAAKAANCNKPDREIHYGRCGTSKGFLRAGLNLLQLDAEDHSVVVGHPSDQRIQPEYWNQRHQGQLMEGCMHDRTRWVSSKNKDRNDRANRKHKETMNFSD